MPEVKKAGKLNPVRRTGGSPLVPTVPEKKKKKKKKKKSPYGRFVFITSG